MLFWSRDKIKNKSLSLGEIEKKVDEYIKGQEQLKKEIILAICDFEKYRKNPDSALTKKNILFIGPSGSGKTLAASTISNILDIPAFQIDCSTLVRSGYVGNSLDDCEKTLNQVCEDFYFKGEKGSKNIADKHAIVVLDEIDKLSKSSNDSGSITTSEVQNQFLAYLGSNGFFGEMRTKNILFIGTGTFSHHYSKHNFDYSKSLSVKEASESGFSPEIFGRFKSKIYVPKPDLSTIREYLLTSKDSPLKAIEESLKLDGNKFSVSTSTIDKLVEIASSSELGIRGVDSIVYDSCKSICYESLKSKGKTFELLLS